MSNSRWATGGVDDASLMPLMMSVVASKDTSLIWPTCLF